MAVNQKAVRVLNKVFEAGFTEEKAISGGFLCRLRLLRLRLISRTIPLHTFGKFTYMEKIAAHLGIRVLNKVFEAGFTEEKAISAMTMDDILSMQGITVADITLINELQKSIKGNKVTRRAYG